MRNVIIITYHTDAPCLGYRDFVFICVRIHLWYVYVYICSMYMYIFMVCVCIYLWYVYMYIYICGLRQQHCVASPPKSCQKEPRRGKIYVSMGLSDLPATPVDSYRNLYTLPPLEFPLEYNFLLSSLFHFFFLYLLSINCNPYRNIWQFFTIMCHFSNT